jgi:hypothetical protein
MRRSATRTKHSPNWRHLSQGDVQRWTGATSICQRICKAYVFNETFGVNSAFNAEVFVAAPHPVAMEFDPFGEAELSLG